jgi:hypothetical protein
MTCTARQGAHSQAFINFCAKRAGHFLPDQETNARLFACETTNINKAKQQSLSVSFKRRAAHPIALQRTPSAE